MCIDSRVSLPHVQNIHYDKIIVGFKFLYTYVDSVELYYYFFML